MFKKHKSLFSGLALLCCLSPTDAKEINGTISWSSSVDSSVHVLSMVTGEHLAYYADHIDTLQRFDINFEKGNALVGRKGHLFVTNGLLLATFSGSGQVFEIDTINNRINRQDRTFYQGYNFDAYQFVRNDTIFSFGGYGFWLENNLLTYFSEVRREWNFMSNAPFPVNIPEGGKRVIPLCFYDRQHEVLYTTCNGALYAYSFLNHIWSKQGNTNIDLNKGAELFKKHRMTDTTLLVMSNNWAWEINFHRNTIIDRGLKNGLLYNQTGLMSSLNCMYSLNEHTLLIPKISDVLPIGYSFEYFTGQSQNKGQVPLFTSSRERYLRLAFLVLAILVLVFLLTISWRRLYGKTAKIKAAESYFSTAQTSVLLQLLSGPLFADDLNSILNVQEKSWEVQRRQRSIFLKELNVLGLRIFQVEIILREKSPTDKRQVVYVINPQIQDQLAQLLP
jgi:hypothetical protein